MTGICFERCHFCERQCICSIFFFCVWINAPEWERVSTASLSLMWTAAQIGYWPAEIYSPKFAVVGWCLHGDWGGTHSWLTEEWSAPAHPNWSQLASPSGSTAWSPALFRQQSFSCSRVPVPLVSCHVWHHTPYPNLLLLLTWLALLCRIVTVDGWCFPECWFCLHSR